jgi:hypothetical protein
LINNTKKCREITHPFPQISKKWSYFSRLSWELDDSRCNLKYSTKAIPAHINIGDLPTDGLGIHSEQKNNSRGPNVSKPSQFAHFFRDGVELATGHSFINKFVKCNLIFNIRYVWVRTLCWSLAYIVPIISQNKRLTTESCHYDSYILNGVNVRRTLRLTLAASTSRLTMRFYLLGSTVLQCICTNEPRK